MINREFATIAIMILSVAFGLIFQAQGLAMGQNTPEHMKALQDKADARLLQVRPAGSNMTTGSNMTGAAGNTTAHGSSIPTAHPAGLRNSLGGGGAGQGGAIFNHQGTGP